MRILLLYWIGLELGIDVVGFANIMTIDYHCTATSLSIGSSIMSQIVEHSSNRTISASGTREGEYVAFKNNSVYIPGEKISFGLTPATTQMVWQVTTADGCTSFDKKPAFFEGGACDGLTRTLSKSPVLIMPESEGCVVKVVNGWATSYKSGVKLSSEFVFNAGGSESRQEEGQGEGMEL